MVDFFYNFAFSKKIQNEKTFQPSRYIQMFENNNKNPMDVSKLYRAEKEERKNLRINIKTQNKVFH